MKKILFIMVVLVLGLISLKAAFTFSLAAVSNDTSLKISESDEALISFVGTDYFDIEQGEGKGGFLLITNNTSTDITYTLRLDPVHYALVLDCYSGTLNAGGNQSIALHVGDYPEGDVNLTAYLEAAWVGGSAEIKTEVSFYVNAPTSSMTQQGMQLLETDKPDTVVDEVYGDKN